MFVISAVRSLQEQNFNESEVRVSVAFFHRKGLISWFTSIFDLNLTDSWTKMRVSCLS